MFDIGLPACSLSGLSVVSRVCCEQEHLHHDDRRLNVCLLNGTNQCTVACIWLISRDCGDRQVAISGVYALLTAGPSMYVCVMD
jgi:hypothetical protein